ncbi:Gfo/Idh/MocA family protein [Lewinella sp. IMCC34183]|uniref:Gfo/Idh/MocA family protein n=1 Tax=Lewinella sp. IMCC34183 TaxID=2248762 RepID=UPI000E2253B9|nr:Gfo/Idh/MocA family oxidoreductase [Lewinella sp. IMCC34183]
MLVRFAVIGLGHIGRRHASLIAAHPGAELAAVCDTRPRAALDWPTGVAPHLPLFPSLADLLSTVPVEVACICTPNGHHADQAIRCLNAGLDVVVEKPLALTVADCDAILAAADRAGRRVFGVMQNRYSPASAWLKDIVDAGLLGRIRQVHLDCFWNRDARYYRDGSGRPHPWHGDAELDGGVLFTQFAHFIDLLCWVFGAPRVAGGRLARQHGGELYPFADTGQVQFDLPGGILGSLNFSTVVWDQNFESTLTVIAEEGTVKLGGQYMNEVRYCHARNVTPPALPQSPPANNYGPYQGSAANHHFVIDNVVEVRNGRAEVATTGAEGRTVVAVIQAIHDRL